MAAAQEPPRNARQRLRIRVLGAVQGVGFRPFLYRQSTALGLDGWVGNSPEGVILEAEGSASNLARLLRAIREAPPANASVSRIETEEIAPKGASGFSIRGSEAAGARLTEVLPDLATCEDCLRELEDPGDRRFRYPFINCTHCGPRYSIIEDIPYDRARTAMRHFPMCPTCRAEYENPADRRFHAEPNACPDCGPRLALSDETGRSLALDDEALLGAAAALRGGRIVAVKGIGGFHLLVDARLEAAVLRLRHRKRRPEKPLAVMFPSLAGIRERCQVSASEEDLLTGAARPIVLLRRLEDGLAPSLAPGNPWLGAFLPYAPLHHLLLRELGFPVVATSGNASEEPIVIDEKEALTRLGGIADLFLLHDRPIVRPLDDSVARVIGGKAQILRRARGYAPAPIALPAAREGILAFGGHQKSTVALTRAGAALLSQHLGDLETLLARKTHARAVADTIRLYEATPRRAVRDLHPDYASSLAAEKAGLPVVSVPHHLAHVAACLAEHGMEPPALGVAWDGAGYGPDGSVWGGEFLAVREGGWRRLAHLRSFRLPGGEVVAREPRRAALGLLYEAFGEAALAMTDLAPVASFTDGERSVLGRMLARGVNAPWCSSMGRLFDSFAALSGLRQKASYEGEAAAELEWASEEGCDGPSYPFPIREPSGNEAMIVDWQEALAKALADWRARTPIGRISAAFHRGLAAAICAVARRAGEERVVLSGGCFQNRLLTELSITALEAAGFEPLWHRRVPPNDGGIALGQAAWSAWSEKWGGAPCA